MAGKQRKFITYIGSPYQTSAGEAGQMKRLLILDQNRHWSVVESVELSLGPRHFSASTLAAAPPLKKGDRIRIFLGNSDDAKSEAALAEKYRENGVNVTLVLPQKTTRKPRIENIEEMSMEKVWRDFCEKMEVEIEVTGEGAEIINSICLSAQQGVETNLKFLSVELKNYACFKDVKYNLDDRGLVWVRGKSASGPGSSNGSGKTTLMTSILWGLVGGAGDVILDDEKNASVTVHALLNGHELRVVRSKKKRARAAFQPSTEKASPAAGAMTQSLVVFLNGENISASSLAATQEKLDKLISIGALKWLFHTENTPKLLRLTDSEFKKEMADLLNTQSWEEALSVAKGRRSEAETKINQLNREILRATTARSRDEENKINLEKSSESWERDRDIELKNLTNLRNSNLAEVARVVAENIDCWPAGLHPQEVVTEEWISAARSHVENTLPKINSDISLWASRVHVANTAKSQQIYLQRELETAAENLKHAETMLKTSTCESCGQSVTPTHVSDKISRAKSMKLEAENKLRIFDEKIPPEVDIGEMKTLQKEKDVLHKIRQGIADAENISRSIFSVESRKNNLGELISAADEKILSATILIDEMTRELDEATATQNKLIKICQLLGPKGIQSFVTDEALAALQHECVPYLDALSEKQIEIQIFNNPDTDRLERIISVRSSNGNESSRTVSQLSGGQFRRVNFALSLALGNLLAKRAWLNCNLIVFDEIIQQLDSVGRKSFARFISSLRVQRSPAFEEHPFETILIALQDVDAKSLGLEFDHTDTVEKHHNHAIVICK